MYCREPFSYARSAIFQRLRNGNTKSIVDEPAVHEFATVLQRYVNVFGKSAISLRRFDKESLPGGDVVRDFLVVLGLPDSRISALIKTPRTSNIGLSRQACAMARAIAKAEASGLTGGEFHLKYSAVLDSIRGETALISKEEAAVTLAAAERHLVYLRTVFGMDIVPDYSCVESEGSTCLEFRADTIRDIASMLIELRKGMVARPRGRIVLKSPPMRVAVGEKFDMDVDLINEGSEWWFGTIANPLNVSYHWIDANSRVAVHEGRRTQLSRVSPGGSLSMVVTVKAPDQVGTFTLVVTLVQEDVAWFEDRGFTPARCQVQVTAT
jgi:hypothetical protein